MTVPKMKTVSVAEAQKVLDKCLEVQDLSNKHCNGDPSKGSVSGKTGNGLNTDCSMFNGKAEDVQKYNAHQAGNCRGLKESCNVKCEMAAQQLEQQCGLGSEGPITPECQQINRMISRMKNAGNTCKGNNPEPMETAYQNLDEVKAQLEKECKGKTGADPKNTTTANKNGGGSGSGGGGGGDSTGGGSGAKPQSTGGGGMGALASMLPALMSALGQQQQPQQQPQQMAQQNPYQPQLDKVDCSVNPALAGCPLPGQATPESWNKGVASAAEPKDAPTSSGDFNVADTNDMKTASADTPAGEGIQSEPMKVAGVPNGGGGMPGGAGGGGAASLGGGGAAAGGGYAPASTKTDILNGERSGGGYAQMAAGMGMKNGEGGGGYTYGGGGYGHGADDNIDLSQFLPGGKRDPTAPRNVAGVAGANYQIQSKEVNIWNRISDRIRTRCSQGLLRDCIP